MHRYKGHFDFTKGLQLEALHPDSVEREREFVCGAVLRYKLFKSCSVCTLDKYHRTLI